VVSARQAAYLQALGVDVYVPRGDTPLAMPRDAPPPAEAFEPDAPAIAIPEPVVREVASEFGQLGWDELRAAVAGCERCELHRTRTQTVFGVGNRKARWMFIGEAPGVEEDRQGEPFVGRAGQLLNSMLRAIGLAREDVFIANVLKCRPPNNRDPRPEEATRCRGYLERQVALVNPTLIVAVGRIAAQELLATETPIARLRGKVHSFGARGWPLMVMYHPAYLLRSPSEKRKAWLDLVQARQVQARLQRDAEVARA
jgi:uracil-DNA glycosylase family 4